MSEFGDKAEAFSAAVREWIGNSPVKAAAFGGACAVIGYLSSYWPF